MVVMVNWQLVIRSSALTMVVLSCSNGYLVRSGFTMVDSGLEMNDTTSLTMVNRGLTMVSSGLTKVDSGSAFIG